MTWAEVKKQIEDGGVTDDMEMWYIDISFDSKLAVSPEVKDNVTALAQSGGEKTKSKKSNS